MFLVTANYRDYEYLKSDPVLNENGHLFLCSAAFNSELHDEAADSDYMKGL
jgi:hypothetical protein